ncbi:ornithine carbamoyltransferase [Clostridium cylindrosporum]|uniref:Ornithine carbamoyltransferase n=1 Tax=Clostridium cylindrosporum DSM 605 TaxID=1121307 RepID=A0A0J8DCS7_CLOCY|nr:ornithine carbamoyltransferase [Clostridium cylindrosporum]KMT22053.1 ornithine carbamoyltransferase ArgF [Clostridium cylindrosporum DSM 605]
MPVNLKGRSFLTLMDFTKEEIRYMLDLAHDLKAKKRSGVRGENLRGKNIVLLFEKTSTRTRCSFEVAAIDEGAHVTFLDPNSSQVGKKESIEDSAKVLGRLYDGIEYRGYSQETVEALAKFSGVPVYNGLTDIDHPTQILADFMTIEEHIDKKLNKVKLVFVGDIRNNMSYALMYGSVKMGVDFVALGPKELWPDMNIVNSLNELCAESGGSITITDNIDDVKGADVIYTDVWVSMGEEDQLEERVKLLEGYRVDMNMIKKTENEDVKFMHCLPAYHDFETKFAKDAKENHGLDVREVTDEVFRSKYSIVFDEAENRMHSIKSILVATL